MKISKIVVAVLATCFVLASAPAVFAQEEMPPADPGVAPEAPAAAPAPTKHKKHGKKAGAHGAHKKKHKKH